MLAFQHPVAGRQFVKGTIEPGESPARAAVRELLEESGLSPATPMVPAGVMEIGAGRQLWHIFFVELSGLPDHWRHRTADDHGHVFTFFWHPLDTPLDAGWHPLFHDVHGIVRSLLAARALGCAG